MEKVRVDEFLMFKQLHDLRCKTTTINIDSFGYQDSEGIIRAKVISSTLDSPAEYWIDRTK